MSEDAVPYTVAGQYSWDRFDANLQKALTLLKQAAAVAATASVADQFAICSTWAASAADALREAKWQHEACLMLRKPRPIPTPTEPADPGPMRGWRAYARIEFAPPRGGWENDRNGSSAMEVTFSAQTAGEAARAAARWAMKRAVSLSPLFGHVTDVKLASFALSPIGEDGGEGETEKRWIFEWRTDLPLGLEASVEAFAAGKAHT